MTETPTATDIWGPELPPDNRPYRRASEPGDETTIDSRGGIRHTFRQVGWHGQTGAFYSLDEDPSKHEPGSFSPLWLQVFAEPILENDEEDDHINTDALDEAIDMDLEAIREAGTALGQMLGRYTAAKTLFDKAITDAAHGELKWAGLCDCEPEATPEEQAARADAEQVITRITEAYAKRPTVVVLCGSTRFYEAFQQANYDETMAGNIVLSVGFYPHSKAIHGHGEGVGHDSAEKVKLDELHLRKIDLADEVLILNVNGYVGESTRREIDYAISQGKTLRWLEPGTPDTPEAIAERARPFVACKAPDPSHPNCFYGRPIGHDPSCRFVPVDELPASADDEGDETAECLIDGCGQPVTSWGVCNDHQDYDPTGKCRTCGDVIQIIGEAWRHSYPNADHEAAPEADRDAEMAQALEPKDAPIALGAPIIPARMWPTLLTGQ